MMATGRYRRRKCKSFPSYLAEVAIIRPRKPNGWLLFLASGSADELFGAGERRQ